MAEDRHFDFGENWKDFSSHSLGDSQFLEARKSIYELVGDIRGKTFLDIGCGSGIFSLAAKKLGARKVIGFDISKNSIECAYVNKERFVRGEKVDFYEQSILGEGFEKFGKFDIVYSWGVLHHTGNMQKAIINAARLVKKRGILVISIYNRHWSSPLWKRIKAQYNLSSDFNKKVIVYFFYVIMAVAKLLVTLENPFKNKRRGMNFYYDVVDWVGGYPYEYTSKEEIINLLEKSNFALIKFIKARVPTGCNEFIFKRKT